MDIAFGHRYSTSGLQICMANDEWPISPKLVKFVENNGMRETLTDTTKALAMAARFGSRNTDAILLHLYHRYMTYKWALINLGGEPV